MRFRTKSNVHDEYRRGGVAHSREWREWARDDFSDDQYDGIVNDRKIRHEIIPEKPPVPVAKKNVKKDGQDDILSGK